MVKAFGVKLALEDLQRDIDIFQQRDLFTKVLYELFDVLCEDQHADKVHKELFETDTVEDDRQAAFYSAHGVRQHDRCSDP